MQSGLKYALGLGDKTAVLFSQKSYFGCKALAQTYISGHSVATLIGAFVFSISFLASEKLMAAESNLVNLRVENSYSTEGNALTRPKARPIELTTGGIPAVQNAPTILLEENANQLKPSPRPKGLGDATAQKTSVLEDNANRVKRPTKRPASAIKSVIDPAKIIAQDLTQQEISKDQQRLKNLRSASRLASLTTKKPASRPRGLPAPTRVVKKEVVKPTTPKPEKVAVATTTAAKKTKKKTKASRVSSTFNKRSLSLVGVFGTPSNRKVLFRTSTGSYQTKKKGQSIGGWKLVAIGESNVKLVKGSRNKTLRMPE